MTKLQQTDTTASFGAAIHAYRQQNYAEAERIGRQIIGLNAADKRGWLLLGAVLRDVQQVAEAEACFRKVIALDPSNADGCANLGLCCDDLGRTDEGIAWQEKALAIMPQHVGALLNLGTLTLKAKKYLQAEAAFLRADGLGRTSASIRGLAGSYKKLDKADQAIALYRAWLKTHPSDVDVLTELGLALLESFRWVESKDVLEQARSVAPGSVPILANLGTVYRTMFKYAAALEAWEAARALQPDMPELLVNLGSLYRDLGRTRDAEDILRRAIALRPDYANAHNNLGNVFRDEGRTVQARQSFLDCIGFDPEHWCAWSNMLFTSQNIGTLSPETLATDARHFGQALHTAGLAGQRSLPNDPNPERVLRIGYLSPDFLTHSVSYFLSPILAQHDRSQVHVTCFANQSAIDPMTKRLQALADDWHFVEDLTDDKLEALIRKQEIDVLVDLAGHTAKNRLPMFARQVAPVQVTWIGYPDTTGVAEMNYRLTDAWADPVGQTDGWHTEQLWRLPQGFLCYSPIADAPDVAPPPCQQGAPLTFGSFNSLSKVDPALIVLWSRVLHAVPGARLMLKSLALDATGCREIYLQAFEAQGIDRSRLQLIGKIASSQGHLAKYGEVDIALDTFPYHGTTTTCEALWMGVPVITLAGVRHVSRVGVSLLQQVGLAELIAEDEDSYIALAVRLAADPQRLARYRQALRAQMAASPLCDAVGKTAALEAAFRQMWRSWCTNTASSSALASAPRVVPALHAPAPSEFALSTLLEQGRESFGRGDGVQALAAFAQACQLCPQSAEAWGNQGAAQKLLGRLDAALVCYDRSLALNPGAATVHSNRGAVLLHLGSTDAAEAACRQAIALDPGYAKAFVNLGLVLASKRKSSEALDAYERAIALNLKTAETYCNMAATLFELGRLEEAVVSCENALALNPAFTEARANLSTALIAQGRLNDGLAQVRLVLEQRPGFALAHSNLLMTLEYDDTVTPAALAKQHRAWGLRFGGRGGGFDFSPRAKAERRLRLGFVSTDLNAHPVGFFLEPLLAQLDHHKVELFLYAANAHTDEITQRLRACTDHWRSLVGLDAQAAASLVFGDGVDVLFDLNGHTRGNRLDMFALRPAPIQINWLGYPDTTGLPEMDYRLSDVHADPVGTAEVNCTEQLVRLPNAFLCYQLMPNAPDVAPAPGLGSGVITFGSFNNLSKISPTTIWLWSQVVLANPGSRLLIKAKALTDEGTRSRLGAAFAEQGLAADRIELRGWTPGPLGHLAQYHDIDVALDTYPYHGTTTTCEALSMGVPVVTLAGSRHAARVGVSILHAMGRPEWVAADEQAYIAIASQLAADRRGLGEMRSMQRAQLLASDLCDAKQFAQDFEDVCLDLWRQWQTSSERDPALVDTIQKDTQMNPEKPKSMLQLPIPGSISVCVPDNLSLMTPYVLLEQQDWFEDEIHFVRRLVEAGTAAIDIGANYGVYTLTIAKAVGPQGRVWAFEPASTTADYLAQSLLANGFSQVELIRAALSDHEGEARLSNNTNAELNTLNGPADGAGETVPLTMLDSLLEKFAGYEVGFIKLDAEGEEPKVISGGKRFLTEQSPLVMFEIKDARALNLSLVDHFAALGYASYRLVPGLGVLVPFDPKQPIDPYQLNLFACKPERARSLAARGLLVAGTEAVVLPMPKDDLWFERLSEQAWASAMLVQWQPLRSGPGGDGWARHRDALNCYALSGSSALPAAARFGALARSLALLSGCIAEPAHLPRLSSLARVAAELGQRGLAVKALGQINDLLQKGGTFDLGEPFLPPDARFESIAPAGRLGDWIVCGVTETLEQRSRYSSYFGPEPSRKLLAPVAKRAFFGDASRRRLELIDRLARATSKPTAPQASLFDALPRPESMISIVDVGAMMLGDDKGPYASLVSRGYAKVIGFEPNAVECDKLNKTFEGTHHFYPFFIGSGKAATFYETNMTMTGSLFKPNRPLLEQFTNLHELVTLVAEHGVSTRRLDDLEGLDDVDVVKIDVQGAELAVFKGGQRVLSNALFVHTEVEFVELYEGQPLFADVDQFLRSCGFQFHTFEGFGQRSFKPLTIGQNQNRGTRQILWSDAIYVRDFMAFEALSEQKLLKLAIVAHEMYRSYDLAYKALSCADKKSGGQLAPAYLVLLQGK